MNKHLSGTFGEQLFDCLTEGIAYSKKHMGRARLVQEHPARQLSADRIEQDIRAIVSLVKPVPIFLTYIHELVKELSGLAKKAEQGSLSFDMVPDRLWDALDISNPKVFFDHETGCRVIAQSGVLASESSGDQIDLRHLKTVFELYPSYHLGQVVEAA